MPPSIKITGSLLCPFVQRCRFVMEAGKINYTQELIDLKNKPDWFLKISPTGKVPLMLLDDRDVVFESHAIMEYLADVYPEAPRHPEDPLIRARHRAWISFIDSILMKLYRFTLGPQNAEKTGGDLQAITDMCLRLSSVQNGRYFAGKELSLVDAAVAPLFVQLNWLRQMNPEINPTANIPAIKEWIHALMNTVPVMRIFDGDMKTKFYASLPAGIKN